MVENVMKQLISKDILYEPMKEMQAKVSRLYVIYFLVQKKKTKLWPHFCCRKVAVNYNETF